MQTSHQIDTKCALTVVLDRDSTQGNKHSASTNMDIIPTITTKKKRKKR